MSSKNEGSIEHWYSYDRGKTMLRTLGYFQPIFLIIVYLFFSLPYFLKIYFLVMYLKPQIPWLHI